MKRTTNKTTSAELVAETSVLQRIAASPADDTLRLEYAQLLVDMGIGWGQVIPLLLSPEAAYGSPQYLELEKLVDRHLAAWLRPIRKFISGWSSQGGRGLLSTVDAQARKFVEAAEAISLRAPRGLLTLGGLKAKDVPALAATPLGRFGHVNLSQQGVDDDMLGELVASPFIRGVERWDLSGNLFGDVGHRALAGSSHFASCIELVLGQRDASAGPEALAALLASKNWPCLRWLDVGVTEVGAALSSCTLELESLFLGVASGVTDELALSIARTPSLRRLTVLSVVGSGPHRSAPLTEAALLEVVTLLPRLAYLTVGCELPLPVSSVLSARR